MIRIRVDASGAKRKMREMMNASPGARRAAVLEMTRIILLRVAATAPRDTNRYVRGWMEAGNKAGVSKFALPGLNRSGRYFQIQKRMGEEVGWWQYIVDRNTRNNRRDKYAAQAQRRLDRAREEYRRMFLAENGAVIGINTFSALGGKNPARAIFKVYGGDGRVINIDGGWRGGGTVVQLHNKEAHASMVERNTGCMRKAYSAFKGSGLQSVKAAYLNKALAGIRGASAIHSMGAPLGPAGGMGMTVVR